MTPASSGRRAAFSWDDGNTSEEIAVEAPHVGERSAPIRARICDGLTFLGIELDGRRNAAHASVISSDASRVAVRLIPTDEQLMIARSVCRLLETTEGGDDCRQTRTA
jgi:Acetokinase family